ncbi:aldo/keto reductase family oxidoreductase [Streptomyces sp. RKAG293]|uniref:aldo/keto reductase n=1 Tax=Streptomyces sp. RKAG293 TaxID=2893403 RepID=UPI0020339D57|nr:aldo/keto reductase [Streptomyces sp. RKAG293]MCM2416828.1 aldo/keto reductase [Streptomyces sp. RKAG293]
MAEQTETGRLIYGCMGLGGSWGHEPYTAQDIAVAEAAVEAALDSGINTFDHADIYRSGKAEAVFGEILGRDPELRKRIVVQTKCGIRLKDGDRPGIYDLRGTTIVERVEQSLARLRTDVLDVLLLHRPDPLADPDDVAEALTSLHRQGLVRRFGVSNMSAAQIAHLQGSLEMPLVADQLEMSLRQRGWVEAGVVVNTPQVATVGFPLGTLEYCRANGVQLQAWGALAQGRYSGRQETPDEQATARLVEALAKEKDTSAETILLWWLQRHPAGVVPVVGTVRPERIRACRDAATGEPQLSHAEWYDLWLTARGAPLP